MARKKTGCLPLLILVGLALWVISKLVSSPEPQTPNAVNSDALAPKAVTPLVPQGAANPDAISPSSKPDSPVTVDAVSKSVPSEQTPSSVANATDSLDALLRQAEADADNAKKAAHQAKEQVRTALITTPAYIAAQGEAQDWDAKVKAARAAGATDLPTISQKWIAAKGRVGRLEELAYRAESISKAEQAYRAADAKVLDIQGEIAEKKRAQAFVQSSREAALARIKRTELIEKSFSGWDGSHKGLEQVIKASMHNPRSYEHVATKYWDMGDYLVVSTQYRGTNVFGAVVTNWAKAKVDLSGDVLEILSTYP